MNNNYGLVYPSEKDYYDVNVTNNNFSKLADGIDLVKGGGLKKEVVIASFDTQNKFKEAADFVATKNNGSEIFTSAVSQCCEGGRIVVLDGTYYFNFMVNINKSVQILGFGAKTRIIQGNTFKEYALFNVSANNTTLKDISFSDNSMSERSIHLVCVSGGNIAIGNCDFTMERSDSDDSVAPVYTDGYRCRILMVGCYIRKHKDSKYSINAGKTILIGVVAGNYCENIDTDEELSLEINVINKLSASRVKYGAQNTVLRIKGAVYNG